MAEVSVQYLSVTGRQEGSVGGSCCYSDKFHLIQHQSKWSRKMKRDVCTAARPGPSSHLPGILQKRAAGMPPSGPPRRPGPGRCPRTGGTSQHRELFPPPAEPAATGRWALRTPSSSSLAARPGIAGGEERGGHVPSPTLPSQPGPSWSP